jgi:hypothetical protein
MYGSEWLSLIERLHSVNKLARMYNCTYYWLNKFTVQVSSLITFVFLVCITSHFTRYTQHKLVHLNHYTNGHVWSLTVAAFQRFWGACEWFNRHQNCVRDVSFHFMLELNTPRVLSFATYKNLKDWVHAKVGSLANVYWKTRFLVCVWERTLEVYQAFEIQKKVC